MAVSRRGIWSGLREEWWVKSMTTMWPVTRRGQSVGTVERGEERRTGASREKFGLDIERAVFTSKCDGGQSWDVPHRPVYTSQCIVWLVVSLLHVCCSGFSYFTCFSSFFFLICVNTFQMNLIWCHLLVVCRNKWKCSVVEGNLHQVEESVRVEELKKRK